ncbi:MAG: hypothetical protein KC635_21325 [Myxococcales bacterium]|nr:hypothetical protein [Myxococcales bacterium]
MSRERRMHYRLRYPEDSRPAAWIDGVERELSEVSARGARFVDPTPTLRPGTTCVVELRLASQPAYIFEGAVVLRLDDGELVVWLPEEIDSAVILREQRRLIRRARRITDPAAMNALRTWPPQGTEVVDE